MRICIRTADGRIIDSSSKAPAGALIANALANGYIAGQVQEQVVSADEFKARRATQDFNDRDYRQKRAPEYPPITDQLDDLFKAGRFSPEMTAKLQAVKDRFPKPGVPPLLFDTLKQA